MRRLLQDELEDHLAGGLLEDKYHKGDRIHVKASKTGLRFNTANERA
jgi:ATP-dependent Clp protease ATP-binding subunit ClpA